MLPQYVSPDEAVNIIESGNRVFLHGGAATPHLLLGALFKRAGTIKNVELISMSLHGFIDWEHPEILKSFYLNSLFVSDNTRGWANTDRGDYVPVFLSEIPRLFENNVLPLDVAIVQVSPPDKHGYCTLGTSVDAALSAVRNAKKVIAQINPNVPRVLGDGFVHISRFTAMVWAETELVEVDYASKQDAVSEEIGKKISNIIEDGSTLQMGIGTIPDAVLRGLSDHKGLGVHTEMFSDGIIPLVEKGVITNEHKKVYRGQLVCTFILGTKKIYDFVDNNPAVNCMDVAFVNDTAVIRRNPKVVAINSAIEIDLTGQVCADSIGTYQYSGIGGQMDFMRGASLSEGGKPIIALPSTTKNGLTRIVPLLRQGAGVVTTRGNVHYVATEYGVVNLYGKNMDQRASLLISIAHPDHRDILNKAFYERFKKMPSKIIA
jgi:acyl-CoA hydrolase